MWFMVRGRFVVATGWRPAADAFVGGCRYRAAQHHACVRRPDLVDPQAATVRESGDFDMSNNVDWERIADRLAGALQSFTCYDGSGSGGAEDSNRGDWSAAESALDEYASAPRTENVESRTIRLRDLPPIHGSHTWGEYGHFGEARCVRCDIWTDAVERGDECPSTPENVDAVTDRQGNV
jgi:hypothetical protein